MGLLYHNFRSDRLLATALCYTGGMRIDKLLYQLGIESKKTRKRLLQGGQVLVDGKPITSSSTNVDPSLQHLTVSGNLVTLPGHHYFILNKPQGAVTATSDRQFPTVLDSLAPADRHQGLYPIGRLDRDTEGLVLLTDNGPLGFRMLHPQQHVEKIYEVTVNGQLADDAPVFFEQGVAFLDGTTCQPARLEIMSAGSQESRARITIAEGKFHQVKKMFLAYGVKVIHLKRIAFGGFELGDLASGAYRRLTPAEEDHLKQYLD